MFYNLYPEDASNPVPVIVLREQGGNWVEVTNDSTRSASGLYNFVCIGGTIYVNKASRTFQGAPVGHIDIARGGPVDYAGEVRFAGRKKRGILRYWNNESGHYKPPASAAHQAQLPLDVFRPQGS